MSESEVATNLSESEVVYPLGSSISLSFKNVRGSENHFRMPAPAASGLVLGGAGVPPIVALMAGVVENVLAGEALSGPPTTRGALVVEFVATMLLELII